MTDEITIRRDGYELVVRDSSGLSLPVTKRIGSYDELGEFVSAVASLPDVEVTYLYQIDQEES